MRTLSPALIRQLLEELASRAQEAGISARVLVVGGAAVSFHDAHRRLTVDIDAFILPDKALDDIADAMARAHDLPTNWINAGALAFLPPVGLEDWHVVIEQGPVTISIASPQLLLAMKLYANRGTRDSADIEVLLTLCDISSVEQAQEIYERYHAQEVLTPSAEARVRAWLDSRSGESGLGPAPRDDSRGWVHPGIDISDNSAVQALLESPEPPGSDQR